MNLLSIAAHTLILSLCFFASVSQGAFLTMTLSQEKSSNLKGWKIYYAAHVTDQAPSPAVTKDSYDGVVEWVGFSAADTVMPIESRPWGLYLKDYPGYEQYYWEPELTFYLPGLDPAENTTYYFIATATGLNNTESDPSNEFPYGVYLPGQPSAPETGYRHPGQSPSAHQVRPQPLAPPPGGEFLRINGISIDIKGN